jgi:Fuc2NAc and GlcNAc transferase
VQYLLIFPVVFILSLSMTFLVRKFSETFGLIDTPNSRSSHSIPIATGGGIAIVISFFCAISYLWMTNAVSMIYYIAFIGTCFPIAIISLIDDYKTVANRWKFLVQLIACTWAVLLLQVDSEALNIFQKRIILGEYEKSLDQFSDHSIMVHFISIIMLAWLLNLYNFMDGIDGLAASEGIFSCLGAFFIVLSTNNTTIPILLMCLMFSILGFIIINWPPAKIFMGDVGSVFIGSALGIFILVTANANVMTIWSWLILLAVFFTDASFTLARRVLRRDKWYRPHRTHAFQLAAIQYNSHKVVTLGVIVINIFWLFPLAYFASKYEVYRIIISILAYFPILLIVWYFNAGKKETVI